MFAARLKHSKELYVHMYTAVLYITGGDYHIASTGGYYHIAPTGGGYYHIASTGGHYHIAPTGGHYHITILDPYWTHWWTLPYCTHSLLCLKTLTVAPESLAPMMREVWFNWSLMSRSPCKAIRYIGISLCLRTNTNIHVSVHFNFILTCTTV